MQMKTTHFACSWLSIVNDVLLGGTGFTALAQVRKRDAWSFQAKRRKLQVVLQSCDDINTMHLLAACHHSTCCQISGVVEFRGGW